MTLSQAGPSPETRLCWILVSFQRFPGLTSSTLPRGSEQHPSVRSHQLWSSVSGSCSQREGCQGRMPGLPGSQSLLSQQAGFGPVNPVLPLTTEELQLRSLRADSSEKQKVDFPTDMFSISTAHQGLPQHAGSHHPDCRFPHPESELCTPKQGQLGLDFMPLSLGTVQSNYSEAAVIPVCAGTI